MIEAWIENYSHFSIFLTLIAPSPQPAAINFPSGENLTQKTSEVLSEIVILGTSLNFLDELSESSMRMFFGFKGLLKRFLKLKFKFIAL